MKIKATMKKTLYALMLCAGLGFGACSLDEYNPTDLTADDILATFDGIEGMTSYCYQPLYSQLFTATDYHQMTELGTDLWITRNQSTYVEEFAYYEGLVTNTNASNKLMKQAYSAVDKCNSVIARAEQAEGDPALLLQLKGEAECLRAFYYSILVEQYGNITLFLEDNAATNLTPQRNTIEEIYTQIVSDLKAAAEHLKATPSGNNAGRVSKKTALGLLARAYIQGHAYGLTEDGKSYAQRAKEVSEELINNAGTYNAYLYPTFEEAWLIRNNRAAVNREALFIASAGTANTTAAGSAGSSSVMYRPFLPAMNTYTDLGMVQNGYYYGRANDWHYVPTTYLMDVFKEGDKRYDLSFVSAFSTYNYEATGSFNKDVNTGAVTKIDSARIAKYGLDPKWEGTLLGPQVSLLNSGWLYQDTYVYRYPYEYIADTDEMTGKEAFEKNGGQAVYDVVPMGTGDVNLFTALNTEAAKSGADADLRIHLYFSRKPMTAAEKADRPYPVVTVEDAYNADGTHKTEGESSQIICNIVPFIIKNLGYDGEAGATYQNRNGDVPIMRMAEVYLIAAEANQLLGNTQAAADWINVLHERACDPADFVEGKMKVRASEITEDYILDEYARELCYEYQRWYVLKRHHAFEDRLARYNVRAARSFDPNKHYLRPLSQEFLNSINNADEYGKNPGY